MELLKPRLLVATDGSSTGLRLRSAKACLCSALCSTCNDEEKKIKIKLQQDFLERWVARIPTHHLHWHILLIYYLSNWLALVKRLSIDLCFLLRCRLLQLNETIDVESSGGGGEVITLVTCWQRWCKINNFYLVAHACLLAGSNEAF